MARIKFNDLPKDMTISKEEMKKVLGGSEPPELVKLGLYPEGSPQSETRSTRQILYPSRYPYPWPFPY